MRTCRVPSFVDVLQAGSGNIVRYSQTCVKRLYTTRNNLFFRQVVAYCCMKVDIIMQKAHA